MLQKHAPAFKTAFRSDYIAAADGTQSGNCFLQSDLLISPERTLDLPEFTFSFHPVLHVSAIAAHMPDHGNLTDQRQRSGINIVTTGISIRMIRDTNSIP